MKRFNFSIPLLAVLVLGWSQHSTALAQTVAPKTMSYQGYVTDLGGTPLDGTYDFTFRLFDVATFGSPVWSESYTGHPVTAGNLDVVLGSQLAFPTTLDFGKALWLEIQVAAPGGTPTTLPRIPLQSTPYANFAHSVADGVVTTTKLSTDGASVDGQVLTYDATGGTVIWSQPTASLPLPFTASLAHSNPLFQIVNSGSGNGIEGHSVDGNGVYGVTGAASKAGVSGMGDTGIGVYGSSGDNFGVRGESAQDAGVSGFSQDSHGIVGTTFNLGSGGFVAGVYGENNGTFGFGVHGDHTGNGGTGVLGSGEAIGVHGTASSTGGANYGVFGQTLSDADGAKAVYGWATANSGVVYGLYGEVSSPDGYALYADGRAKIAGVLLPAADNQYDLGASTERWQAVFATNGTIQTSDRRLKSHITDLGYGLDAVLALRPVAYQWKDKPEQGTKLGLIAQEVATVVPEVVSDPGEVGGYLGMNYAELVPVLIRAIQQQQQIIEQQEKALGTLEAQMTQVARLHDEQVLTLQAGN